MQAGSTKSRIVIPMLFALACTLAAAQTGTARITGTVLDPAGRPVAGAHIELDSASGAPITATTGAEGEFTVALSAWGDYTARVQAQGFAPVTRKLQLSAATKLAMTKEGLAPVTLDVVSRGSRSE